MDAAERTRLKTLANDAVIDLFGVDCRELNLAQAVESSVEELEYIADECEHCKFCDTHGAYSEDGPLTVEVDDVIDLHKKLAAKLKELKDYHVRLAGQVTGAELDASLESDLGDWIDDTEEIVDELEALALP